jgi:SPP1 family predicted phage head-tail adaptor
MRAGDLRKRITFQQRSASVDGYGQQVTTWTDMFTVWAEIEALTARELFAAQSVQSEATHMITVRYRTEFANPSVTNGYRIAYGGRIFNISGATDPDERKRTIKITAAEGLNNG